ncbi:DUF5840 family protein [Planktothrix agardhii 1811]|uniref:anacyclamide/piricyclamide family prenylated cyclic peptide n=1 Tax=Planktothrix agardhii TaxID=1160 RepID=UPI001F464618|nr:anacyclamide/piricyclamide family prenylated cyclic peptide [Planktothrix agardhii]MCF3581449.1 DUF5840 family protein [Planktothrix agardhii 1811]
MTKKNLKPQQAAPVQREMTTQSSPLDSNTNLKKCQKSFSTCHGARFASMN